MAAALMGLAFAGGAEARGKGDEAAREFRFADALVQYTTCASGSGRDARYCEARRGELAGQARDDFAGWTALERVRRDYSSIGSDVATAEVTAALAVNPGGPAGPELRRWLANESLKRGEEPTALAAVAATSPQDAAWLDEQVSRLHRDRRHRVIGAVGVALSATFLAYSARGPGPLAWRSAAWAAGAVGLAPLALAALWDSELAAPFAWNAAFCFVAVLLAPRAPRGVAVLGTLGGLTALGWWHGWLPKLGVP